MTYSSKSSFFGEQASECSQIVDACVDQLNAGRDLFDVAISMASILKGFSPGSTAVLYEGREVINYSNNGSFIIIRCTI